MNFREATDHLFNQIDHSKLAEMLHVSVATVRQARLSPGSLAHRAPPKEWERGVLSLAEQQIDHYRKLADAIRKDSEKSPHRGEALKRGRALTD